MLESQYNTFKGSQNRAYDNTCLSTLAIYATELLNRENVMQGGSPKELRTWVTEVLLPTYLRKNHDYGNSFDRSMDDFGTVVAKIRIGDKVLRYLSITDTEGDDAPLVHDESVMDTLLDMCNYCIMSLMWIAYNV
jgi:hypothetical protein